MNLNLGCLVAILAVGMVMHVQETEAGCNWGCWVVCYWGRCYVRCGVRCTWGKREAEVSHRFPAHFETYDHNADGFIDLKEFAKTLKADPERSGTLLAFLAADSNEDKKLDREEFEKAPFLKFQNDEDEAHDSLFGTGNDDNGDQNGDGERENTTLAEGNIGRVGDESGGE